MKLNYKFFLATLVVLTLLPISSINAQQTSLVQGLPQIYVTDLSIPQRQMKAGDEVKGTFTLFNNSQTNAPDVFYLAALVGDFKDNVPTVVYGKRDIGKTFLAAGEKKNISFTYQLPKTIAGNELGIRVQSVFAGLYMGWRDAKIIVVGTPAIAKIIDAKLIIAGKEFVPETGPVVPKSKGIEYRIKFSNPTTEVITFLPRVKIFNRMSTGELLQKFSGESVTITAKGTSQTIINLPTFDYKSLVYAVELEFIDAAGEVRAPSVTGRYMILGDMATIQSVAIDKDTLAKGETVNVTVFYQPPPFDQFSPTSDRPRVGEADVAVTLYDENNALIGAATKKINLDLDETSAVLPLMVTTKAHAIGVTAVISKNGTELSTYSTKLTPSAETGAKDDVGGLSATSIVVVIAIVILILGAFLLKLIKKNRNSPPNSPPSATTSNGISNLAIALLVGATLAVSWGLSPEVAQAWCTFTGGTLTGCSNIYHREPDVFVNNPINGSHFAPGNNFNLEVRQIYNYCLNVGLNGVTTWTITLNGVTKNYESQTGFGGNVINMTYSFPLVTPSTPGTYRIDIKVDNYFYGDHHWTKGYIEIVVDESSPDAPVLDDPTEGPGGGDGGDGCLSDIKLNWSSSIGALKYEVYRDGTIIAEIFSPNTTYTDSFATAGLHNYYIVAVADSQRSSNSNTVSATKCSTPPSVSLVADPNPATANKDIVTWTATPSGGSCGLSGFSFRFNGDDNIDEENGSSGILTHKYYDPGSYSMQVKASKNGCETVYTISTVEVNPNNLTNITCEPSPKTVMVNQEVTWTAIPNPDGDYIYTWSGDDGLSGGGKSIVKNYLSPGVYRAEVDVDDIGNSHCESTVNVKIDPRFQEF
ncbi:MAG: Fibronectin type III domain protein [Candidatus Yanofskybacteria bacterium GW2011_GWC2_37_9]|uniref:Fibronectin type III domain protein n=2 Tax=Parcubacteria group TaxID=1794811 RepID=A0A0G0HV28_9BACT|nr:MAG: Fibronectin type III domain protein [Candidatus Yanofskybacteria bacterium GW2011_GWC2_37_9]